MKSLDNEPPEVSLLRYIPQTRENRFFYENGLSKIIPKLKVKVHTDIESCYYLWNLFSPKKTPFDLWDFRLAWYEGYKYKLYFYTLYEKKTPLAVLPLWFDEERKRYEWFGSYYMEDNKFFVKDEQLIDILIKIAPKPISLDAIEIEERLKTKDFFTKLILDEPKFVKDISGFSSIDDLLATLSKKNRYHLKSDFQRILAQNPKTVISNVSNEHLTKEFIRLNMLRFDNVVNDESDFHQEKRKNAYLAIIKNAGVYKIQFNQVYIQNYLAAIDLAVLYNGIYAVPRGGNDVYRFKGIGNFMVYFDFEDAIKKKYSLVDCLQIDYDWKHRFFDQRETYRLVG